MRWLDHVVRQGERELRLASGDSAISPALRVTDVQQPADVGTAHADRVLGIGLYNMDVDGNLIDPQRPGLRLQLEYEATDNGTQRAVTGATNASPIVVTVSGGTVPVEGDTVFVEGVLGNTAANGYRKAKNVNAGAGTFELWRRVVGGADVAVAGNGAYAGGGKTVDRMAEEVFLVVVPPGIAGSAQLRPFTMRFNAAGTFKSELSLAGTTRFYSTDSVTPLLQIPDGTGALQAILGTAGTSVSLTSAEKIDITAGAASVWSTGAGGLTVSGFTTLALASGSGALSITAGTTAAVTTTNGSVTVNIGGGAGKGFVVQLGGVTKMDLNVTTANVLTIASGIKFSSLPSTDGTNDTKGVTVAAGAPYKTEATADTTTTSASYVLVNSMTLTPPAGTYRVRFSGTVTNNTSGGQAFMSIYAGGSLVAASERRTYAGSTVDYNFPFYTEAEVTVDGAQAIEGRWLASAGTNTMHQRQLFIERI